MRTANENNSNKNQVKIIERNVRFYYWHEAEILINGTTVTLHTGADNKYDMMDFEGEYNGIEIVVGRKFEKIGRRERQDGWRLYISGKVYKVSEEKEAYYETAEDAMSDIDNALKELQLENVA